MKAPDVRVALRWLAVADALMRLGFRLAFWAASAFLAWSVILIAATVSELPARLFHAAVMAVLGSLPAFLAAPFRSSEGMDAVRRVDRDAAVESWLSYGGGPAERLIASRAVEAISIANIAGFGRPRLSLCRRRALAAIVCAGLLAFVCAQIISIRAGYGLSVGYPDKANSAGNAQRTGRFGEAIVPGVVPEAMEREPEGADAPGARRYGRGEEEEDPLASPPSFGKAEYAYEEGIPEAGSGPRSASDGSGRTASGSGAQAGTRGQASADGGPDSGSAGEAKAPGWEGSGGALDPSPLVDYRARFERQYASVSGKETSLGRRPSADVVSAAIADYYASFDARVALAWTEDRSVLRAMEAWRRAFGTEDRP